MREKNFIRRVCENMVSLIGLDAWLERPYTEAENHFPECEDGKHYVCHCGNFILDGGKSRNWCNQCGKFAPRPTKCICHFLEDDRGGWED